MTAASDSRIAPQRSTEVGSAEKTMARISANSAPIAAQKAMNTMVIGRAIATKVASPSTAPSAARHGRAMSRTGQIDAISAKKNRAANSARGLTGHANASTGSDEPKSNALEVVTKLATERMNTNPNAAS